MDMDQERSLVTIQRIALKKIVQNVAHEGMSIQAVQKKIDIWKWKGIAKINRKEIFMTTVEGNLYDHSGRKGEH